MKLIVGLGNPGRRYKGTRHNLGFSVVENLTNIWNLKFKKRFNYNFAELFIEDGKILFVKPLSFMNLSGVIVKKFFEFHNLNLQDLLVICDDLNLPLGKIRIRRSGSSGGHKGLQSIIDCIGTKMFPRLRIGIRNNSVKDEREFVLKKFKNAEVKIIKNSIRTASDAVINFIKFGIDKTMEKYN